MRPETDWRGTACLLRAGLHVSAAGHLGALIACLGMLHRGAGWAHLTAFAAWGYLLYLQVRVGLDAELFTWLADGGQPEEIDGFLAEAGLRRTTRERTNADRRRGALRLLWQLMAMLAVELAVAVVGLQ